MRYRTNPRPAATGLADEDNYQIEVWDREDGALLGIALRTSIGGTMHQAWQDAVEHYPGKYLVWTNGPYIFRSVIAPTGKPDQFGMIDAGDATIAELPQWYGLVGRCECGYMALIDRYDRRVTARQHWRVPRLAEKVPCPECKSKRGTRGKVTIWLCKLPR